MISIGYICTLANRSFPAAPSERPVPCFRMVSIAAPRDKRSSHPLGALRWRCDETVFGSFEETEAWQQWLISAKATYLSVT